MHRVPQLQWKTWVRLAFVEAGSDWRSLKRLAVEDGMLRDYLLAPEMSVAGHGVADLRVEQSAAWNHGQHYGVHEWTGTVGAIAGQQWPNQGRFAVADPRHAESDFRAFRVVRWDRSAGVVTGARAPGGSALSVSDPRTGTKHNNCFRVVSAGEPSPSVTAGTGPSAGGLAVADPRPQWERHGNNLTVMDWETHSRTVIGGGKGVQGGWMSVADPRPGLQREPGDAYQTAGHYGVVQWDTPAGAVSAAAGHDNGRWSVADPRLPAPDERVAAMIIAEDGTFHRPFTTFELGGLQSLYDPEEWVELDGLSDSAWRERIGNAVPSAAAEAIGEVMGTTLLLAWSGETFILSAQPIWVRPMAAALVLAQGGVA